MPKRLLRDWTDSERIDRLSHGAEVMFTRLIMAADDYGRFTAKPALIVTRCFPLRRTLTDDQIVAWRSELVDAGLIELYHHEAREFMVIRRFGQSLRAKQSRFPAPPNEECETYDDSARTCDQNASTCAQDARTCRPRDESRESRAEDEMREAQAQDATREARAEGDTAHSDSDSVSGSVSRPVFDVQNSASGFDSDYAAKIQTITARLWAALKLRTLEHYQQMQERAKDDFQRAEYEAAVMQSRRDHTDIKNNIAPWMANYSDSDIDRILHFAAVECSNGDAPVGLFRKLMADQGHKIPSGKTRRASA